MTETFRLADQIRRAFEGSAWHGDPILELLADVDAKTAAARPIKMPTASGRFFST